MIATGRTAPWEGVTQYGSWRRLPPEDGFFADESIAPPWEWVPPPPPRVGLVEMSKILTNLYLPAITKQLNEPTPFLAVLEAELGTMKGRSEKEHRAEVRRLRRALERLLGKGDA